MWAIPPHLLSTYNVTMQGWPFAGQEAIPEVTLRKQPFPWLGCDIAVLFHISQGRETQTKCRAGYCYIPVEYYNLEKISHSQKKIRTASLDLEQ